MYAMTHSYVCHFQSYVCHDTFVCVELLNHMYAMKHPYSMQAEGVECVHLTCDTHDTFMRVP